MQVTRLLAPITVAAQGAVNRIRGRGDTTGLTTRCDGKCGDASPHDAHLAAGALAYLGCSTG